MASRGMRNYRALVDEVENLFCDQKYLEAFLVQCCLFEGVIKNYALLSLRPALSGNADLENKAKNFEPARLVDLLFVAEKITKELYDSLTQYRKKRNEVIHRLMDYKTRKDFDKELREAYEAGRFMKGFLVDEMIQIEKGKTMAEITATLEKDLTKMNHDLKGAFAREIAPIVHRTSRDLRRVAKQINTRSCDSRRDQSV